MNSEICFDYFYNFWLLTFIYIDVSLGFPGFISAIKES